MPLKPCVVPGCPRLSDQSRCEFHRRDRNASWSRNRDHAAHKRFARALQKRAGNQCERCGATEDLRACHILPIAQGGTDDLANGILLCKPCDQLTDSYAR